MKKYTETHMWMEEMAHQGEGRRVRVGLSQYGIEMIGPIVWIELPEVGTTVQLGDVTGVVESTKAAVDLEAPCAGVIFRCNAALDTDDGIRQVNEDPEGSGWFYELDVVEP